MKTTNAEHIPMIRQRQFRLTIVQRSVVLLMLALLSACAPPFAAAPTPVPTAPPATPTQVAVATPRPTTAPGNTPVMQPTAVPEGLVLWTTEQGNGLELVRTLAAEFSKRGGMPISVVPKDTATLRLSLLADNLANEAPPDLIWGDQNDLADLLADNQLQPVEPPGNAEKYLQATIAGAGADDKLWGAPITAQGSLLLLYNRALVQQPPATTDELIVQARATRGNDQYGLVMGWMEARWLLAWLNGFGGAPTGPDGSQPTLDTPQMIAALDLLRELGAGAPPNQRGYGQGSALFGNGQVALAVDGDWSLPNYRTLTATLDLGIAPLPRVPATGRPAAPALGAAYLMLHRDLAGDKLEQARALSRFLAEPDTQIRIARDLGRLPALRAALTAPAIAGDPALAAAAAQAEAAIGLPPTKAFRCALRAIERQLPVWFNGQLTQEQAANAMQQDAEACVKR